MKAYLIICWVLICVSAIEIVVGMGKNLESFPIFIYVLFTVFILISIVSLFLINRLRKKNDLLAILLGSDDNFESIVYSRVLFVDLITTPKTNFFVFIAERKLCKKEVDEVTGKELQGYAKNGSLIIKNGKLGTIHKDFA